MLSWNLAAWILVRFCASQSNRDFRAPDLERSALDPIPLDTLWSLHNEVFFIASTLHLDEIFKFLEISAREMFMKVQVSSK